VVLSLFDAYLTFGFCGWLYSVVLVFLAKLVVCVFWCLNFAARFVCAMFLFLRVFNVRVLCSLFVSLC